MKHQRAVAALKTAAVAVLAGLGCYWWFRAPVPGNASLQTWRIAGLLGAAVIGGIGTALTGAWLRAGAAVAVGVTAGAVWAAFTFPNDVRIGLLGSATAVLTNFGGDFLAPAIAAGLAGAFLMRVTLRARS